MSTLFVLRNQDSLFINRQGEWVSGREANTLFRAKHKDEALNEVFEISARDFGQRITVEEVEATEKGQPIIPADWIVDVPEPDGEDAESEQAELEPTSAAATEADELAPTTDSAADDSEQVLVTEPASEAESTETEMASTLDIFQARSA